MTKNELAAQLKAGAALDSIMQLTEGQCCMIFKAEKFTPGDDVLYIPDIDLNEILSGKDLSCDIEGVFDVLGCCYTGEDFIELCGGDAELAERLFLYCDWQHPSSALPEIKEDD